MPDLTLSPFHPVSLSLLAMTVDPWILSFAFVTVAATIFMGFWSAKKSKTASDFFVAGRSVSVGWNASAISGEYLSAASFMGVAGMVMSSGYDALWYPVCYACGYLFLLLFIAGPLRRFGAYTIPDFAEGRFDSPLFRKIAVVFVLFIGFFYTMPQMKGAGTTLAYIFPGLPYWVGVALVGAVITLNVALGGMKGITLVQAFQYWAKMFAISVPVFVLMMVYGHYGKQVGVNAGQLQTTAMLAPAVLKQDFKQIYRKPGLLKWSDWQQRFKRWNTKRKNTATGAGFNYDPRRFTNRIAAVEVSRLLSDFANITDQSVAMALKLDDRSILLPVTNGYPHRIRAQLIQSILLSNGVVLAEGPLGITAVTPDMVAIQPLVRAPLPAKAPADATWLNPFGPLTTKAAKAANAVPRWNLSPEVRSSLVDFVGRSPQSGLESVLRSAEHFVEGIGSGKSATPRTSQFADWTNMPTNTSRTIGGGFPMLSTLRELGLLLDRPVLVATNLPRPKLVLSGSFQTRDQFLKYLETLFLSNGVRLDLDAPAIKALPVTDWERYQKDSSSVVLVPNLLFSTRVGPHEEPQPDGTRILRHTEPRILVENYGELLGKRALMAANLPTNSVDFNPTFEVMLVQEAKAAMEKTLAEQGITLIPAGDKEVWAVPTAELKNYQLPPIDPRPYSLLYTYSLIIAIVCGTAGLPHILVRFYTNPDGAAAKRTTMWVMILIGVFYVFPPVFGVIGRNLLPELYNGVGAKGTDKIVLELPRILNERYGTLGSILSGITCAGAFAAFMSTFSGLLVSMTGALAHDVYGRILRPKSTPEQRMRMFKIGAVLIGGVAILLGSFVEPLEINFMVGQAFAIAAASYFPLLFMAVWWRKLTMKGAAVGMLMGGVCALVAAALTNFSNLASDKGPMGKLFSIFAPLNDFWAAHPLLKILCEQPAIWSVPLAITLMIVVSKLTAETIPADSRMKMLVLHAPEQLGLKQEYIQEHQPGH